MGVVFRPDPGSRLSAFVRFCEQQTGHQFASHAAFDAFAAGRYRDFWRLFLDWSQLLHDGDPEPVCTDDACERATFFPNLRLSYVENLLQGPPDEVVLIAAHADRPSERLTRRELSERVGGAADGLARLGVGRGDRVVALAGNNAEAVVAGLAAAALGATLSAAPPDMGTQAIVSRLEQLQPKLLLANLTDAAPAAVPLAARVAEVAHSLPSLDTVVALDDGEAAIPVRRLSAMRGGTPAFARFPFNHPLFVLFTSGTTGRPKCIVHGAGGTLLEHVKEHRLHVDLRARDTLFFHTSTAWMMWNWQLSALASGSAIVVYDGAVGGPETLWEIVSRERVTVFGTSPPYLQLCEDSGYSPPPLPHLRAVLSTGSILHERQYDWVAEHVGPMPLQSISGGTDIVGCFVLGNPNLPVRRGWIQCRSLALDVRSLDGELVCANPFPSRPLGFYGDDGRLFHEQYFSQHPGVWTHGDLLELDADGYARIDGRSDGVINAHGIRIGPADIYTALRDVAEVRDAVAVEQHGRIVLLVVLAPGAALDAARIRREIARNASPAHVPELIAAVPELPTTHGGKRSERAARDAVNGRHAANAAALRNPESLEAIGRAVAARKPQGATVLSIWEEVLGVEPLTPDDDFFELGGTSLAAVRLCMAIHRRLGVELPLSTLVYARTPAAMAEIVDGPPDRLVPPLVLLRAGDREPPLFLVHAIWGDVLSLRPLALQLETDRPVYALQARGLDPRARPHTRIEEMAAAYVETVRARQPDGPYALAGHSLGGLVAYEMARLLGDVEWLGLLEPFVHHRALPPIERARHVAGRSLRAARARVAARTRIERYRRERTPLWAPVVPTEADASPVVRRLVAATWKAFEVYRPAAYDGDATYFETDGRPSGIDVADPLPAWRRAVRGTLEVERIPSGHDDLLRGSNVALVAARISAQQPIRARSGRSRDDAPTITR